VPPVTYFVRMVAKEGNEDEVESLLLSNIERIRSGKPGSVVFAVHRSTTNPREFWLYETWEDEAAVERHESGEEFRRYRKTIGPLVEPDSVVRGNTAPIAVLGYAVPSDSSS
jgi:quinol monooxygenase YgiN